MFYFFIRGVRGGHPALPSLHRPTPRKNTPPAGWPGWRLSTSQNSNSLYINRLASIHPFAGVSALETSQLCVADRL